MFKSSSFMKIVILQSLYLGSINFCSVVSTHWEKLAPSGPRFTTTRSSSYSISCLCSSLESTFSTTTIFFVVSSIFNTLPRSRKQSVSVNCTSVQDTVVGHLRFDVVIILVYLSLLGEVTFRVYLQFCSISKQHLSFFPFFLIHAVGSFPVERISISRKLLFNWIKSFECVFLRHNNMV